MVSGGEHLEALRTETLPGERGEGEEHRGAGAPALKENPSLGKERKTSSLFPCQLLPG